MGMIDQIREAGKFEQMLTALGITERTVTTHPTRMMDTPRGYKRIEDTSVTIEETRWVGPALQKWDFSGELDRLTNKQEQAVRAWWEGNNPATHTPTGELLATEKQIAFIDSLQRTVAAFDDPAATPTLQDRRFDADFTSRTRREASAWIDALKADANYIRDNYWN